MSEPLVSHATDILPDRQPSRRQGTSTVDEKTLHAESVPARSRELIVLALFVALFDLVVYRGQGYAGYAFGFVLTPLLLWAGSPRKGLLIPSLVVKGMLWLLAVRMLWLGHAVQILVGLLLVAAFSRTLAGRMPYVLDTLFSGCLVGISGLMGLPEYARLRPATNQDRRLDGWAKIVMPTVVVLGFGVVFVQANPDLKATLDQWARTGWELFERILGDLFPTVPRLLGWMVTAWLSIGLLRPMRFARALGWLGPIVDGPVAAEDEDHGSTLVPAIRNTLVAVNVLFAVYLVFEFTTLWCREFPQGFYYAGYAHAGAAWLTIALAMATLVLSAIFRGRVLRDVGLGQLQRLAWIWSALNLLLAVAVYHRLWIYIEFNGMTRMRTVGLVGVTTVLVGFVLVVWKVAHGREFLWLIERQLWALAVGLFVLVVLPIDALVHRYNVRRILSGDPAPVVQITEHDVDSGGLLALRPLLAAEEPIIQRGIAARLKQVRDQRLSPDLKTDDWTTYQAADRQLNDMLEAEADRIVSLTENAQDDPWDQLRDYAYQWY